MEDITLTRKGSYDVIVVGGGIAGVSAAVSAARGGVRVLLIEKLINLGGLATSGLISWYEPLCDGRGRQMIGGIAEELIRLAVRDCFDTLPESWGGSEHRDGRFATHFSPTVFSLALDRFVLGSGAALRFDTYATYPLMEGRHCVGVICESADGRELIEGKAIIDATGSASICRRAGMPTVCGENFMSCVAHYIDDECIERYRQTGRQSELRKWFAVGSNMFGHGHPEGMKKTVGDSADELNEYILTGKKMLLDKVREKRKGGFDLTAISTMPQLRTIRRIVGAEDFEAIDGKPCDNPIGVCGDFRPGREGKHYMIPYGALVHPDFDNLFACGRIISAPAGDGWEVARVIPTCALTGEAAGKAAAESVLKGIPAPKIRFAPLLCGELAL